MKIRSWESPGEARWTDNPLYARAALLARSVALGLCSRPVEACWTPMKVVQRASDISIPVTRRQQQAPRLPPAPLHGQGCDERSAGPGRWRDPASAGLAAQ